VRAALHHERYRPVVGSRNALTPITIEFQQTFQCTQSRCLAFDRLLSRQFAPHGVAQQLCTNTPVQPIAQVLIMIVPQTAFARTIAMVRASLKERQRRPENVRQELGRSRP
jgi:hypothetical protein